MRATHWLEAYTHHSAAWWIAALQERIRLESKPTDDPNHSANDPKKFLSDVASSTVPTSGATSESEYLMHPQPEE